MDERQQQLLFGYLGRHLVALCGVLHPTGKPQEGRSFCASAFVIELDGEWYCVTAGHVLQDIAKARKSGEVLQHCNIADYFGMNAINQHPTVIAYDSTPKLPIFDRQLGLDIGALRLRPFYVAGLQSNGVQPVPEQQWLDGDASGAQQFAILGFPLEEQIHVPSSPSESTIHQCFVGATPCPVPEDAPQTHHPMFVGTLNSDQPNSMKGFSGGPIFRLRLETEGERKGGLSCWMHAVQVSWHKPSRVVFGCPMTVVAQMIRERQDQFSEG